MKKKKKNKILDILMLIFIIGVVLFGALALVYKVSIGKVSDLDDAKTFVIKQNTNSSLVIKNLKTANLIKSEFFAKVYLKVNKDIKFKAGTYTLKENMTLEEVCNVISNSSYSKNETVRITFIEGDLLKNYAKKIADVFGWSEDDVIKTMNDKTYLKQLVNKYWFLTDEILKEGIYYPLEGYLHPNTYEFYKDSTIKAVIEKLLNQTGKILDSKKEEINNSGKTVHEILSASAIIEKEAINDEDRKKVSQVINKRLEINMNLGMDVTTYYGVQRSMKEPLYKKDLADNNPYNTRLESLKGLPIGPICNPSISSINAALNPSDTDYIWFFADIKTGKVYFTNQYNEFLTFREIYG